MADLKPISAFNAASAVDANTLFLVSTPNGADYDSENASAALVADAVVNDFEYTQDLSTVSKKVTGAINENKSVIGYSYDEYDPTTAYSKDDLCIYNNVLYKARQATTGNLPTNTTYWEQTSIANEINELNANKANSVDFDGCKFKVLVINSNSTVNTPTYTEICTAIIGRGQAGMFVATNNGVVAILDNQLIRTARVPSGNTQYMSIQNDASSTVVGLIIYK